MYHGNITTKIKYMAQITDFDKPDFVPEKKTSSIINHSLAMYKGVALYGIIAMLI